MASNTITVHDILNQNTFEVIIGKDETVKYVEDLLVKELPHRIGVNPIGIHLFALFHPRLSIWLCPNQPLSTLASDLKKIDKFVDLNFNLRIRFIPYSSIDLFVSKTTSHPHLSKSNLFFVQLFTAHRNVMRRHSITFFTKFEMILSTFQGNILKTTSNQMSTASRCKMSFEL